MHATMRHSSKSPRTLDAMSPRGPHCVPSSPRAGNTVACSTCAATRPTSQRSCARCHSAIAPDWRPVLSIELPAEGATRYARAMTAQTDFVPLTLCVLTVSDTRTPDNDTSGDYLALSIGQAGHRLHEKRIVKDNRYEVRAIVAHWIADESIDGVIVTGGTGFTGRDSTPEAIVPLLDKEMPGFAEMFRAISF